MNIAIVGAGIGGLVSAKVLAAYGHDVVIFERRNALGGVWEEARRHAGLKLQSPREVYVLSDHDMPKTYPDHPSAEQIAAYIDSYAAEFGLKGKIRFERKVTGLQPRPDGRKGWRLHLTDTRAGAEAAPADCDHVVVCNGLFSDPIKPEFLGAGEFEAAGGQMVHSTEFRDPKVVSGQDVVVVGFGKSALDVAYACIPYARRVTLVCRHTIWHLPKTFFGFFPTKSQFYSRPAEFWFLREKGRIQQLLRGAGKPVVDFMFFLTQFLVAINLGMSKEPFRPTQPLRQSIGLPTGYGVDESLRALRQGRIAFRKAPIQGVGKNGVVLGTGETVPAKTIVLGTGFSQDLSMYSATDLARLRTGGGDFKLYRNIICPGLPDMSFNGYNNNTAVPLTCEVAAHWIAHLIDGRIKLPSDAAMSLVVDEDLAWRHANLSASPIHGHFTSPFTFGYLDSLLADMGFPPADAKLSWLARMNHIITPGDYAFLNDVAARARAS